MLDTDYYELLQVSRYADDRTIKTAYRKLAMECHPDRNGGCPNAEAKFKAISEAYDCLKDPNKRAAYDRFGHAAFKNGGFGGNGGAGQDFGSFADIFDNIFGEFMNGGQGDRRSNALRGPDLHDVRRPWSGSGEAGLLRRRADLPDLPRSRRGHR